MKIDSSRWQKAQEYELYEWRNAFEADRVEWEEAERKYKEYLGELSSRLNLNSESLILDVGCNSTCVSKLLQPGHHYGVDPLADSLKLQERISDFIIKQGVGEKLPFEDGIFDVWFCRNVIDHTQTPEAVVDEGYRVLKRGGYLILAGYVYNPFIWVVKNVSEFIGLFNNVGHPHTYTMSTFEKLALRSGSKIIERRVLYTGKNPNDFGKVNENKENADFVQKLIMWLNDNIFMQKWFVKEYCLLIKKFD